jgi:transcriptional regulator with PAS, ATPase and Fis domain
MTVGMLPRTERERLMAVAGVVSIAAKVGEKGGTADTLGTLVESLLDRELPLREIARIVEDEAITRALARHGLQRKAAQALGVTERALQLRRQRAQA